MSPPFKTQTSSKVSTTALDSGRSKWIQDPEGGFGQSQAIFLATVGKLPLPDHVYPRNTVKRDWIKKNQLQQLFKAPEIGADNWNTDTAIPAIYIPIQSACFGSLLLCSQSRFLLACILGSSRCPQPYHFERTRSRLIAGSGR